MMIEDGAWQTGLLQLHHPYGVDPWLGGPSPVPSSAAETEIFEARDFSLAGG